MLSLIGSGPHDIAHNMDRLIYADINGVQIGADLKWSISRIFWWSRERGMGYGGYWN